ncbi:MAG: hypothetical protein NWE95_08525 [Candidatus Bathyarchaeota archaeon]|nr:hypothetical protein [Candidatus Bathyarchaeota archaeon]
MLGTRKITLVLTSIMIIALCSGLVSALLPDDVSVSVVWMDQSVQRGETVTLRINFGSNSDNQIVIEKLGLHFDWMENNQFYTYDLSANPVTVPARGSYVFSSVTIQIPPYATTGSHTYYVAIDGKEGTDLTSFGWDSDEFTMEVVPSSTPTATPKSSPSGNGGGGTGSSSDLLLIVAVIAAVVIVALLIVVLMMRRKLKQVTAPAASNPVTPPSTE